MPIALDAHASAFVLAGSSISTSLTVGSTGDRLLVVAVAGANASGRHVTAVTFGGVPCTKTDGAGSDMSEAGATYTQELWTLTAPFNGTHTITVTYSGAGVGTLVASSWTGVDQSTPLGTSAKATGTAAAFGVDVDAAYGDVVIDGASPLGIGTNDASQTLIGTALSAFQSSYKGAVDGWNRMQWTQPSAEYSIVAVPIKDAVHRFISRGIAGIARRPRPVRALVRLPRRT